MTTHIIHKPFVWWTATVRNYSIFLPTDVRRSCRYANLRLQQKKRNLRHHASPQPTFHAGWHEVWNNFTV